MNQPSKVRERVTEAVDHVADAAEEIHKSIAAVPLDVLERVADLREVAEDVRKIQDRSIHAVYELVRGINHEVGRLASELVEAPASGRRVSSKAGSRPRKVSEGKEASSAAA